MRAKHLYEFGCFRLDCHEGVLLSEGRRLRLEPKDLELLLVLVENHGHTVGKEELLEKVWPGTFVEEGNLARHISALRQVLSQGQNGPQYIETIPKRGYRFVAPVREVDLSSAEDQPGEMPAARPTAASRPAAARTVAIAAVVLLLLMAGLALFRRGRTSAPAAQYTQLTNYADSATSPALSPDGRMLAFIRGESTFHGPGQVYVKFLPDGEPFQVTNDNLRKMSPVFSPDAARIAYTTVDRGVWDTWVVPVPGGTSRRMLPNASGLSWIADHRVMFSEIANGYYMKIATSTESRAEERDVYRPPSSELSMAHRSYLSPDRKWVIVVEMDPRGWLPCRLVPFDGSSSGKPVGPVPSKCTNAAWSPDGNWMYFSADTGSGFHIWRQRFPTGDIDQITSAATEEEGIVLAPDGSSFITSVGAEQSTVWLHEPGGDRQITSEGYAYTPSVSQDGSKVYYLVRAGSSRAFVQGELWVSDTASAHHERLLPGFLITRYDISPDGKKVVFATVDSAEKSSLWLARLDLRASPRQLTSEDASRPFFAPGGTIVFFAKEGESGYIYKMKEDGIGKQKVTPAPLIYLMAVSPDGQWVVAWVAYEGEESTQALVAYPMGGGPQKLICTACQVSGPRNPGGPMLSWSRDQKALYFRSILSGMNRNTFMIPLRSGEPLPDFPGSGMQSERDLLNFPGTRVIQEEDVFPGNSPLIYAYTRKTTRRNLYKIPVP
jgi:DNA-binding winged helix-turn-helix (wHTH) protein/Tol biopolymer transport system component